MIQKFLQRYREAFGYGVPLPVAFGYSDTPVEEIRKISRCMIGAMMVLTGKWNKPGVYNVEEFDPDPFMEALNKFGLPWVEDFNPTLID